MAERKLVRGSSEGETQGGPAVRTYIYKAWKYARQESCVPATMYLINVTGARGAAGLERSDCTHKPPSIHSGEAPRDPN